MPMSTEGSGTPATAVRSKVSGQEGVQLKERRKEMFYFSTHSTRQIAKEETRCRHMGYSFRLTARVILFAPSHIQDNTYHSLCYTSRGALAVTSNSTMGPSLRIDPTIHHTMSECSYLGATSRSSEIKNLEFNLI